MCAVKGTSIPTKALGKGEDCNCLKEQLRHWTLGHCGASGEMLWEQKSCASSCVDVTSVLCAGLGRALGFKSPAPAFLLSALKRPSSPCMVLFLFSRDVCHVFESVSF